MNLKQLPTNACMQAWPFSLNTRWLLNYSSTSITFLSCVSTVNDWTQFSSTILSSTSMRTQQTERMEAISIYVYTPTHCKLRGVSSLRISIIGMRNLYIDFYENLLLDFYENLLLDFIKIFI